MFWELFPRYWKFWSRYTLLFCGFVVWQESLIWKKNSNQISYFLCFVNPLLKKSKSAKIESLSSKDKHYKPSHKYGSTFDICNARRYYRKYNKQNRFEIYVFGNKRFSNVTMIILLEPHCVRYQAEKRYGLEFMS